VKRLLIAIVIVIFLLETSAYACTGFCVSQGDLVLVGNNEDWKNPSTKVWYEPAVKTEILDKVKISNSNSSNKEF